MKDFVKKNLISIIMAAICLFLVFSGAISNCSQKRTEQVIQSVSTSVIRDQIIDSINSAQATKEKAKIDSVNKVASKKITALKTEINTLYTKLGDQIISYNADTVSQSPKCDSLIQTYSQLTDSMNMENEYLSTVNENLNLKITILDAQILTKEIALKNSYSNIESLSSELKKQTNWAHRNQKWFYFGVGAILTGIILR